MRADLRNPELTVADVMRTDFRSCNAATPIAEVAAALRQSRCSFVAIGGNRGARLEEETKRSIAMPPWLGRYFSSSFRAVDPPGGDSDRTGTGARVF